MDWLAGQGCPASTRESKMIATLPESSARERATGAPVVARLHGVSKNYGEIKALRQVDFNIHAGELVALLGPNGAGKTTAVKLFLGLAKPNQGTVSVFGGNPVHPEVRVRTGAMLQVSRVPETLRVREHIDLFSSYYPEPLPISETRRGIARGAQGARSGRHIRQAALHYV